MEECAFEARLVSDFMQNSEEIIPTRKELNCFVARSVVDDVVLLYVELCLPLLDDCSCGCLLASVVNVTVNCVNTPHFSFFFICSKMCIFHNEKQKNRAGR